MRPARRLDSRPRRRRPAAASTAAASPSPRIAAASRRPPATPLPAPPASRRHRAAFYAHPLALVESSDIGPGTRVWAWAHVMSGARVGSDCNIGEHCFIESGARLGDRVTVKNGVAVWNGVVAEDDVFLGPNAVLTNDLRPRSKLYRGSVQRTLLKRGASVGANATLLCGITVGAYAMIGAGAVVTRDVPPHSLVVGNPARVVGRVCRCGAPLAPRASSTQCPECAAR